LHKKIISVAGVALLAALALVAAVGLYAKTHLDLVIFNQDTGYVYWRHPVKQGERFSVEFIHSVNKSLVRDTFEVKGTKLIPVETLFYDYDAGMETTLRPGEHMSYRGDAMVISGFRQVFDHLNWIVGTVSDHIFTFEGKRISLRNLCGRNAPITMKLEH
jgi:hypothetical protein